MKIQITYTVYPDVGGAEETLTFTMTFDSWQEVAVEVERFEKRVGPYTTTVDQVKRIH